MTSEHHGSDERSQSFITKWVFSTDHKVIGIQYGITSLLFLLFGFTFVLVMRWQLAYPDSPNPILKLFVGDGNRFMPGGVIMPEFYNALGAMHGTIMIFLGVVPLGVGAFGNYFVPLQVGAPDMAFPRLNMASYWIYFLGGVVMLSMFFIPDGPANSGWTSYPPLSVISGHGQTFWLVGMVLLITSSLLGSINIIVTILQLRVPGLTMMRLPFFVWSQLVTAFLLLLAFPPLEAAGILQLMDRLAGTSFYLPKNLVVSGQAMDAAGGGSPILWQHLFWFLGHPEVYVLLLPAMGVVAEVIANNTRRPIWGYRVLVGSALTIFFLSFTVWAHHMFITGMGSGISAYFEATTMAISIPSVLILVAFVGSLWFGSNRYNAPMLFALGFLPMFAIGGLTGLPLALVAADIALHDTYYVIGHFHYVVAPGILFGLFAGIYYWYPKVVGRRMSEGLGKTHFWGTIIFMNGVFAPMFIQGFAGVSRRLYDGGASYAHAEPVLALNVLMSWSAFGLFVAQLPFIVNFFFSLKWGEKVSGNPWNATTLEWAADSPPKAHGNFDRPLAAYRGPYEYSVPGAAEDYTPQHQPETA